MYRGYSSAKPHGRRSPPEQPKDDVKPLFPSELCAIIASLLGFHEIQAAEIFRTLLLCPRQIARLFSPLHVDLATESFEFVLKRMWSNVSNSDSEEVYSDDDTDADDFLPLERVRRRGTDGVAAYRRYLLSVRQLLPKFLTSSLVFGNEMLHYTLWVYCKLEPSLFEWSHWVSRFVACMELNDMKRFQKYRAEMQKDPRCPPPACDKLINEFVDRHFPWGGAEGDHRQKFFQKLFDARLLPASREILLGTLVHHDTTMRETVLRNMEEARSITGAQMPLRSLNRRPEKYVPMSTRDHPENPRWEEAFKLFCAGAIEEADRILSHDDRSGRKNNQGRSPIQKMQEMQDLQQLRNMKLSVEEPEEEIPYY
jgi:hypothetical protein